MNIEFDAAKRKATLEHRGLDFADAGLVFGGRHTVERDDRQNYGEVRFITGGHLDGRFVVIAWTQRGAARRIISMRYGHAPEEREWIEHLG